MSFKATASIHGNPTHYKHKVGGLVGHGTITCGDSCSHTVNAVDKAFHLIQYWQRCPAAILVFQLLQGYARTYCCWTRGIVFRLEGGMIGVGGGVSRVRTMEVGVE